MRKLAFKVIHSTTKLLPVWNDCVKEMGMKEWIMLRDVTTWWNSTNDMLQFALEYCKVIDTVTAERKNDLHKLELCDREWEIVDQLSCVLKVNTLPASLIPR